MLKLIFKTILIIFILIVMTVVLAVWKGGEPFRWVGDKVVLTGKAIEKFGDAVDEIKKGSGKIKKKMSELKQYLGIGQDDKQEK